MIGIYECLTKGCPRRATMEHDTEVEHEYDPIWPIEKRRRKCKACGKPMLLVRMKQTMDERTKARFREIAARRKADSQAALAEEAS